MTDCCLTHSSWSYVKYGPIWRLTYSSCFHFFRWRLTLFDCVWRCVFFAKPVNYSEWSSCYRSNCWAKPVSWSTMRLNRTIKYVSFVFCVVCAIRITLYAYCGLTYGTQYSLSRCVSEGARYHSDPKRLRNGEHLPRGSHGIRGHDEAGTVERETIQGLRDRLKAMAKGSKKSVIDPEDEKGPSCVKRILFWSRESPEVVAKFSSTEEMCRQNSTCNVNFKISMNWYDFRDSHAVIFHHKVYKDWKKLMRYVNMINYVRTSLGTNCNPCSWLYISSFKLGFHSITEA